MTHNTHQLRVVQVKRETYHSKLSSSEVDWVCTASSAASYQAAAYEVRFVHAPAQAPLSSSGTCEPCTPPSPASICGVAGSRRRWPWRWVRGVEWIRCDSKTRPNQGWWVWKLLEVVRGVGIGSYTHISVAYSRAERGLLIRSPANFGLLRR